MIDISDWGFYNKIDPEDLTRCKTNLLYTPRVSPDGKLMCMDWDITSPYQNDGTRLDYTEELLQFFFDKEVQFLEKFKYKPYAPEIISIDMDRKRIFFKWYGTTCNDIVYSKGELADSSLDWQKQLTTIIEDIFIEGSYKLSLYPHCFYFDDNKKLRTFDFYACANKDDCLIEIDKIKGMLGLGSVTRFTEATKNNIIDFGIFFKRSLEHHIKWPTEPLHQLYTKLYE
jgi:hypothetical protein